MSADQPSWGLVHELRNPLAPILNALQVIRHAGQGNSALDQPLSIARFATFSGWWKMCWTSFGLAPERCGSAKSASSWLV
jgi:hypothetical protein